MTNVDYLALSVRDFAAATADKTPTPGGGSVAGAVGCLAAALGEMSLNFTRGKKKFAQFEADYEHLGRKLTNARRMFESLVADDVAAYSFYQETNKLPDGPEKDQQMQLATAAAINVPRETIKLALALMDDLVALSDKCNPWLISDLVAAGALAVATARLSSYNVRINAPNVADKQAARDLLAITAEDLKKAQELMDKLDKAAEPFLVSSIQ